MTKKDKLKRRNSAELGPSLSELLKDAPPRDKKVVREVLLGLENAGSESDEEGTLEASKTSLEKEQESRWNDEIDGAERFLGETAGASMKQNRVKAKEKRLMRRRSSDVLLDTTIMKKFGQDEDESKAE